MTDIKICISSFHSFLEERKLMGTICNECGSIWLPPRQICIRCHNQKLVWKELKGEGKLVSYSVIHFGTSGMRKAGYSRENPYCVGIVELVEGPRISAEILGAKNDRPEEIRIGCAVKAEFVQRSSWHLIPEAIEALRYYAAFRVLFSKSEGDNIG